jgi:hypothetical protein
MIFVAPNMVFFKLGTSSSLRKKEGGIHTPPPKYDRCPSKKIG